MVTPNPNSAGAVAHATITNAKGVEPVTGGVPPLRWKVGRHCVPDSNRVTTSLDSTTPLDASTDMSCKEAQQRDLHYPQQHRDLQCGVINPYNTASSTYQILLAATEPLAASPAHDDEWP